MKMDKHSLKKCLAVWAKPVLERIQSGPLRRRSRYARYYETCRLEEKTILYEAFSGRGMVCNPYAIFKYLIKDTAFSEFKHVWVLDEPDQHRLLKEEYQKFSNVHFVKYESRAYLKYLCKAKYLINNSTFPPYFTKRAGQVYINTWHGIPLKTLGFDMPDGNLTCANTIRNFLQADYLLAANSFLSKIFLDSYKLAGIYTGKIIEAGYPRIDLLRCTDRREMLQKLQSYGVEVDYNRKIILYAPTWKGVDFGKPQNSVDEYLSFKEYVNQNIDSKEYQILIKPHQAVYHKYRQQLAKEHCFIPASIDATEMLAVTDILVTDYSSIYFDYLPTNKPLFFYIPDLEEYSNYRGLYFPIEDLPGPITAEIETLCQWLREPYAAFASYMPRYAEVRDWSSINSAGEVTPKIAQAVFEGSAEYEKANLSYKKIKILFHRGSMRVNGISTSFLSLLKQLDYDKYDVSVVVLPTKKEEEKELIFGIDSRVRVLARSSTLNVTLCEDIQQRMITNRGLSTGHESSSRFKRAFKREYRRCFGESQFDYILDFDGYRLFYNLIYLQAPQTVLGIWQHNDMLAECNTRFGWLKMLFSLYPFYDKIISCSRAIMEVNRQNLATVETYDKFVYAKNTIDIQRVSENLLPNNRITYEGRSYCYIKTSATQGGGTAKLFPLELKMQEIQLNGNCIITNMASDINKVLEISFSADTCNPERTVCFATMGRLSVEKNQERLIKAFSRVLQDYPNCILYIIGDGPLRKKLDTLVANLKLQSRIILTGNLKNPFGLLKNCDCFILPSLHEGQPMVIHEARLMNMPIIMSRFSSAEGAMVENGQFLIETTQAGIEEGMRAFFEGKVPTDYAFDVEAYNQEAYGEFLTAIGEIKTENDQKDKKVRVSL